MPDLVDVVAGRDEEALHVPVLVHLGAPVHVLRYLDPSITLTVYPFTYPNAETAREGQGVRTTLITSGQLSERYYFLKTWAERFQRYPFLIEGMAFLTDAK